VVKDIICDYVICLDVYVRALSLNVFQWSWELTNPYCWYDPLGFGGKMADTKGARIVEPKGGDEPSVWARTV